VKSNQPEERLKSFKKKSSKRDVFREKTGDEIQSRFLNPYNDLKKKDTDEKWHP